ncbi:MAG: HisA/HisF-related TIM barrel protein [Phycisphaerae bacterium]|nr:HisA/HisF-related TIM barrel protein [Phycisphaerae bacterium]
MAKAFEELRNGVVLAELGGYGNGDFCLQYGRGAAVVVMGTYIIDSAEKIHYPQEFVFRPGSENYQSYLNEHIKLAKENGSKVAVSAIGSKVEDIIEFFLAAESAGADFVSLCAHSAMEMFTKQGLGYKLCMPENRENLKMWVSKIISATSKPLILKPGSVWHDYIVESVRTAADMGTPIVHANLGLAFEPQSIETIKRLSGIFDFVIAGGGITGAEDARTVLSAGAGAVSVAKTAIQDRNFIEQLSNELKSNPNS